jgi:hypothetical protein
MEVIRFFVFLGLGNNSKVNQNAAEYINIETKPDHLHYNKDSLPPPFGSRRPFPVTGT